MPDGTMRYCEGCTARIPDNSAICPHCGIDNPFSAKYAGGPEYIPAPTTAYEKTNPVQKRDRPPSKNASLRAGSPISSHLNNVMESEQSSQYEARSTEFLMPIVKLYNDKDFRQAYLDATSMKLGKTSWKHDLLTLLVLHRVPSMLHNNDLEKLRNQSKYLLSRLLSYQANGSSFTSESIVKSAVYGSVMFAVASLGKTTFSKITHTGSTVFSYSTQSRILLNRLFSYCYMLEEHYELTEHQTLSYTALFLSSLALKLNSSFFPPLSVNGIVRIRNKHRALCDSSVFRNISDMKGGTAKLSFWTKPLEISEEPPFCDLRTRMLGFRLGG